MTRKEHELGMVEDYDMPYQEPHKNLAYKLLKRTIMDALGRQMDLGSDERTKDNRAKIINEARQYIHAKDDMLPLSFETLCYELDIEPELIRKHIPKDMREVKIKLSSPRNEVMKDLFNQGYSLQEIADTFGVKATTVYHVVGKKRWPKYYYKPPNNHRGYSGQMEFQGV